MPVLLPSTSTSVPPELFRSTEMLLSSALFSLVRQNQDCCCYRVSSPPAANYRHIFSVVLPCIWSGVVITCALGSLWSSAVVAWTASCKFECFFFLCILPHPVHGEQDVISSDLELKDWVGKGRSCQERRKFRWIKERRLMFKWVSLFFNLVLGFCRTVSATDSGNGIGI